MRIPRIHLARTLTAGETIELDGQAATHVARVLRMKPGSELVIFDGGGGEYGATIEAIGRHSVKVRLGGFVDRDVESPLRITLAQGVSRGERMDLAIQKSVELGVHEIFPVITRRCVVNLTPERRNKRREHWQSVATSASEQCGRTRVPVVHAPVNLDAWLDRAGPGTRLLLDPRSTRTVHDVSPARKEAILLIGPEGGLEDAERQQAMEAGFTGVRLGPRILRTETAALAALAALQALWGDLSNGEAGG